MAGSPVAGAHLHHPHLMATDVAATISFWQDCFGAELVADETLAGTRNVLLTVGRGRLNLYEQPPNHRGPVNHLGVHVSDLEATVEALEAGGWQPHPIKRDGPLSYSMVEGPDSLLLEVFNFNEQTTPDHLRPYFDLDPLKPGSPHAATETIDCRPAEEQVGLGTGYLSPQAKRRLASSSVEPLRPPPHDDVAAVARWRQTIHAQWLEGDPAPSACGHHESEVGGVRCLAAGLERPGPLVVYFHGGGYALGSPDVAVPITERLMADATVLSVDYRLAPEHRYPAAIEDGFAVLSGLAKTADGPLANRPVVLVGDSAGANIAVSVSMRARAAGLPAPAGLVLLSPHLGFRQTPKQRRAVGNGKPEADPLSDVDEVTEAWLRRAYCGSLDPQNPAVSPIGADLRDLPQTLVQVGGAESGLGLAIRFARRARLAGVDITLDVWDGMWHAWHYHRDLPEADNSLAEAGRFIAALN